MMSIMNEETKKAEKMDLIDVVDIANDLREAVKVIEDQSTWLPLSFTLSDLEVHERFHKDQEDLIREKFYAKDDKGNVVMINVPILDVSGNIIMQRNEHGDEKPLSQQVPKISDTRGLQLALKDLNKIKRLVEWNYKIQFKDMESFPPGLKLLQHKLMGRVIVAEKPN